MHLLCPGTMIELSLSRMLQAQPFRKLIKRCVASATLSESIIQRGAHLTEEKAIVDLLSGTGLAHRGRGLRWRDTTPHNNSVRQLTCVPTLHLPAQHPSACMVNTMSICSCWSHLRLSRFASAVVVKGCPTQPARTAKGICSRPSPHLIPARLDTLLIYPGPELR